MKELSHTTEVLNQAAGLLRGVGVETRGQVDAISQLLVIQCLVPELCETTESIDIPALLRSAEAAARSISPAYADLLVDSAAQFWDQLSPLVVRDALDELLKTQLTASDRWERGSHLVKWAFGITSEIAVPEELLLLMKGLLGDSESLSFPLDSSAQGLFAGNSPPQTKVSIKPILVDSAALYARASYLAGIQPEIEVGGLSDQAGEPATHVFLIPPFGGRVTQRDLGDTPPLLSQSKALSSEQAALLSSCSPNTQRLVALVPSGLLFQGGIGRRFREWLVTHAGLSHVVEFPPGVLGGTNIGSAILLLDPNENRNSVRFVSCLGKSYVEKNRSNVRVAKWQELLVAIEADAGSASEDSESAFDIEKDEVAKQDYLLAALPIW